MKLDLTKKTSSASLKYLTNKSAKNICPIWHTTTLAKAVKNEGQRYKLGSMLGTGERLNSDKCMNNEKRGINDVAGSNK